MFQKLVLPARILLGLIFFVFGLNGLLFFTTGKGFIPMPPPSGEMATIMGGFIAMKYLMPLVKGLQVISGIFLLTGRYVNLALVFLAPIVVNIFGVHLFVEQSGLGMAIFITVLYLIVFKSRYSDFRPLFKR